MPQFPWLALGQEKSIGTNNAQNSKFRRNQKTIVRSTLAGAAWESAGIKISSNNIRRF